MGGTSFLLLIWSISNVFFVLFPCVYFFDLFLITAVFIGFFSRGEQGLFLIWLLGIMKGIFSSSFVFFPLFFIFIYFFTTLLKGRLKADHPFSQFLVVFILSLWCNFLDTAFNMGGDFSRRLFFYWGNIIVLSVLNACVGIVVFKILSVFPIKMVQESEKPDF